MCCRNDYRLSIYIFSECTQLRFVQLFNKALLIIIIIITIRSVCNMHNQLPEVFVYFKQQQ